MRYTYTFEDDDSWMIILYDNGFEVAYFNDAEDDWDKSVKILELFNAPYDKRFYYKLESLEELEDKGIDVFRLDSNGIDCLIRG